MSHYPQSTAAPDPNAKELPLRRCSSAVIQTQCEDGVLLTALFFGGHLDAGPMCEDSLKQLPCKCALGYRPGDTHLLSFSTSILFSFTDESHPYSNLGVKVNVPLLLKKRNVWTCLSPHFCIVRTTTPAPRPHFIGVKTAQKAAN